jgi:hypothetical protein
VVSLGSQYDKWDTIRKEMQKEFESNKAYSDQRFLDNVWGAGEDQKDVIDLLAWRDKEHKAPLKYCMTFPAHRYLIADT